MTILFIFLSLLITLSSAQTIFTNGNSLVNWPRDFKHNQSVVADLNLDGYADLILTENHVLPIQTKIFLNQSGKSFKDIPIIGFTARPLAVLKMARGLFHPSKWGVVVRYPNENLEAYVLDVSNESVTFTKVLNFPKLVSNWGDIQILDHNQDGKLDIFATSFYARPNSLNAGVMILLAQNQDGSFTNISKAADLEGLERISPNNRDATVPSYMANVCDINNDGFLDLLVSGYGRRWNKLMLYSAGKYVTAAETLKFDGDSNDRENFRGNGNSFTPQCGDVNRDGKLDVFQGEITHKWAGSTSDVSSLLYNQFPGPFERFTDFPRPKNFENQGDLGADFGDINLDGNLDLVIANSDYPPETKLVTMLIDGNKKFTNISETFEAVVNPKGVVLFDFDRDGDLDMVVGENAMRGHSPVSLFFKNLTQDKTTKSYLGLILEGDGKFLARSPIGARVTIKNSLRPLVRELVLGGGQDSARPLEAHFALNDVADKLVTVEIRWNAKIIETLQVEKNKTFMITYKPGASLVKLIK